MGVSIRRNVIDVLREEKVLPEGSRMSTHRPPINRLSPGLITVCASLTVLLAFNTIVRAQEKSPQRGFYPGGSYAVSDIESINTTSGNLSLRVPLATLPQGRGGLSAALALVYNTRWHKLQRNDRHHR